MGFRKYLPGPDNSISRRAYYANGTLDGNMKYGTIMEKLRQVDSIPMSLEIGAWVYY